MGNNDSDDHYSPLDGVNSCMILMKQKIRIGCGAGFSGDRLEPAIVLAEKGQLDYLVLECLAERTIALAQKRKLEDPTKGYDPFLERRITSLLPILTKNNVRLITNMGAANPIEGAKKTIEIAEKLGIKVKVAAVYGDEISQSSKKRFDFDDYEMFSEDEKKIRNEQVISANAYLGVEGILEALQNGANVIITGRVADPSLFLAPMIHEFGWPTHNYDLMGKGTVVGHLMECAGHITGGYFADPIAKPVEDMDNLGHPFADIFADGSAIISKVEGTGGVVNLQTAKEQLLYEVINPYAYITPDVVADFTTVKLEQIGKDQVQVTGGSGKNKPQQYKVSVGYKAFYIGEGEISYAGFGAFERASLAAKIIQKRLSSLKEGEVEELRIDYIGLNSMHHTDLSNTQHSIPEIRLRIVAKAQTQAAAALIGEEVEALYTNGPAGGGGVRKYANEVIGIVSLLANRANILHQVAIFES